MLSRVANSLYWTNRYIERVENYARFIGVNLNLALDLPPNVNEQWEPLLIATADHILFYQYFDKATRENVMSFMTFDKRNPNSILSCLFAARENARTIRETISKEMWESINAFYLQFKNYDPEKLFNNENVNEFYEEVTRSCQLFHGIVDATFARNEAWHFGNLGRYLERADKSSRFLDVKYFTLYQQNSNNQSTLELMTWTAVLKSVSAYNMYRQTHKALTPINIVSFLILDRTFPRSITYCLLQAERSLYAISTNYPLEGPSIPAEKLMSKLRSDIEYTEEEEIFKKGLHLFLDRFQTRNNSIDRAVHDAYFSLKTTQSQLLNTQIQE